MDDNRNQSPHHPASSGHGSGAKHALGATVAGAAAVGVAALGIGLAGADEPEITPADAASPDPVVQTVDDSWSDQGPVVVDGDAGGPVVVDGDAGGPVVVDGDAGGPVVVPGEGEEAPLGVLGPVDENGNPPGPVGVLGPVPMPEGG